MRRKLVVGAIFVLSMVLLFLALRSPDIGTGTTVGVHGRDQVGVIFINGIITGGSDDVFGGVAGSQSIMRHLREAASDSSIKAVVIRINSPGGSAAASQEIAGEIQKLREQGKLVVTSMGDVAASGGYWIAASTDYIFANAGTMTGSIGVIMQSTNLQELYKKIGVDVNVIKSGPHKDMGSSARELTEQEREILQAMVDDIYRQFVEVVSRGRGLSREKTERLADGRIYTGKQAKELGLVDELGNYYDAIMFAARKAGIEGKPRIRTFGRQTPLELFLSSSKQYLGNDGLNLLDARLFRFLPLMAEWRGEMSELR
ncbi:MAG: signal peptide peptidase SppA [Thermoanaerobacteraceae bacterium]|nr:signal peptide peptidase SppA [Thermoanaerobacteraceae bacterium]